MKKYPEKQIETAIANMPLKFHEEFLPARYAIDPDTGMECEVPPTMRMVVELRMRHVAEMAMETADGNKRSEEAVRKVLKLNLADAMRRSLFELVIGHMAWPNDESAGEVVPQADEFAQV